MKTDNLLKVTLDAALASEQGDIDIAEDIIKASGFLVALASASLFFMLTQLTPDHLAQMSPGVKYLFAVAAFAMFLSLITASFVYKSYILFRGLCRNLIMWHKVTHAELIEKSEEVEFALKRSSIPAWALIASGDIATIVPLNSAHSKGDLTARQIQHRRALDTRTTLQRRLVMIGFTCIMAYTTIRLFA
jgi:hypothetical protein